MTGTTSNSTPSQSNDSTSSVAELVEPLVEPLETVVTLWQKTSTPSTFRNGSKNTWTNRVSYRSRPSQKKASRRQKQGYKTEQAALSDMHSWRFKLEEIQREHVDKKTGSRIPRKTQPRRKYLNYSELRQFKKFKREAGWNRFTIDDWEEIKFTHGFKTYSDIVENQPLLRELDIMYFNPSNILDVCSRAPKKGRTMDDNLRYKDTF